MGSAFRTSSRIAAAIASLRSSRYVITAISTRRALGGAIGSVPVYNVAVHVTGADFRVFELDRHRPAVETV